MQVESVCLWREFLFWVFTQLGIERKGEEGGAMRLRPHLICFMALHSRIDEIFSTRDRHMSPGVRKCCKVGVVTNSVWVSDLSDLSDFRDAGWVGACPRRECGKPNHFIGSRGTAGMLLLF